MKRELGLFARWILKHYETSDVNGYWCWRDPMGNIVTEQDIVNHYIEDAESKKRMDICLGCPELIKLTKQCKKCGCLMNLKTN